MFKARFATVALCLTLTGCAHAQASTDESFKEVKDFPEPKQEIVQQSEQEPISAPILEEVEQAPTETVTEPYTEPQTAEYIPSDELTMQGGVNQHNGRLETWYSSNVLYHNQTSSWTVDDEGFYRTDEGYYVVAASDMEQGTVFEGSKGECIVLDSGCDSGITDYYVSW